MQVTNEQSHESLFLILLSFVIHVFDFLIPLSRYRRGSSLHACIAMLTNKQCYGTHRRIPTSLKSHAHDTTHAPLQKLFLKFPLALHFPRSRPHLKNRFMAKRPVPQFQGEYCIQSYHCFRVDTVHLSLPTVNRPNLEEKPVCFSLSKSLFRSGSPLPFTLPV